MEINFLPQASEDLKFWQVSGNKVLQNKISKLIESIEATPFSGIGKPEQLKHQFAGKWSRRITDEHRLIYEVEENKVFIFSLRGHYK